MQKTPAIFRQHKAFLASHCPFLQLFSVELTIPVKDDWTYSNPLTDDFILLNQWGINEI